jgi:endonuclease/exonuclease/phosphatase family metal-dependent hydrolase
MTKSALTLMTYNVHGCAGRDGKVSPYRIADVIAQYTPDVVSLQELDMGRVRSGRIDQPGIISRHLNMDFHFSPAFRLEEELYGNAVLSRLPIRLIKSGLLPTVTGRGRLEMRSALWVAVSWGETEIQIVNTHMGLNRYERLVQAKCLLDEDWLGNPLCTPPKILCGDFNLSPAASPYRIFREVLHDAQLLHGKKPLKTWPSIFPITRIDHIFTSEHFTVEKVDVPRNRLSRIASDHLPLTVWLKVADRI